jgi:hypothetical protein
VFLTQYCLDVVQFEIENKYLLRQNEILNKELSLTRYTIQALKAMIRQKDSTINQTKEDLDKSIQQVELLSWSLKQNNNNSSSSSSSSSSGDDSDEELVSSKFDIKSKLFIRQPQNIY